MFLSRLPATWIMRVCLANSDFMASRLAWVTGWNVDIKLHPILAILGLVYAYLSTTEKGAEITVRNTHGKMLLLAELASVF